MWEIEFKKEMTMVKNNVPEKCLLCGGTKKPGKTIFTVDLGFSIVVVRNVPATVCSLCGTDWIDDTMASKLEDIVNDARKKWHLVEITSLSA